MKKTFIAACVLAAVIVVGFIYFVIAPRVAPVILPEKTVPVDSVYAHNTRVQQWRHYYDAIDVETKYEKYAKYFYTDTFIKHLIDKGIPIERAQIYAAIPGVESKWKLHARSSQGAMGLWQIMPNTAKRHKYAPDDMYDPVLATHCAIEHITFLDSLYSGDVAAVLFAYNGGEKTVNDAMKKFKTKNTWLIDFNNRETYDFGPRVLGSWLHNKK